MKWVIHVKCLEPGLAQSRPSACVCGTGHLVICSHIHHHQHRLLVITTITLTVIIVAPILGQVLVDDADCQGW